MSYPVPVPYIDLQREIITVFLRLKDSNPELLINLDSRLKKAEHEIPVRDWKLLVHHGLRFKDQNMSQHETFKACLKIIKEQLSVVNGKVHIRNLLGFPLEDYGVSDFKKYTDRGGGNPPNMRTDRFSHPAVLVEGDTLATGCKLLSPPRYGYNGSILLHLPGGPHGTWISVPARIPIALISEEDEAYLEEVRHKQ